ncbi:MAG: glucose 1-dehydrogenase [Polyangiaceae bacterium]|nr:glucose 1-dehydrogenase [Polyangiaceae bacterium]
MKISLEGKTALVTGASRGIGLAIARAYVENGAKVAIVSRKQENLEQAKAELAKDGLPVETIAMHVGREGAAEELVRDVVARLGKIDILVNNAATNPHFGPTVTADDKVFDKTFETNARAYFALARETAKHLVDRGAPGSLIFVSSTQGILASPLMGVYGMTKAAVISLAKTLAVELGPSGIRVNCIAPGLVDTRFAATLVQNDDIVKRWTERAALRRYGRPEEIAGAAVFLASDAASYITGETIVIDGGYTISA